MNFTIFFCLKTVRSYSICRGTIHNKTFFLIFFRARVDVHRKDSVGSVEKAITIYGQPENCSNACLQILKVMQEEARNTDKSDDIPLKILGM